ncbi:MAG: STAS domain-containing protein [Firmicutes bacterium]|nr:STAS domain-containing protein [Bacillota bacterium]MBQ5961290.1 STAS domain-containing protein [Bacillota bacterium]
MNIERVVNGTALTVAVSGRLDTVTAPELETSLGDSLKGITDLTFDFAELEYISSAGLRVLLSTQKIMNSQGSMKIIHANEAIKDIFEVTGFVDIMTIE